VLVSGYRELEPLRSEYAAKEDEIAARLAEFRRVGSRNDERLFEELCFCLLAIQTKARAADAAVRALAVDDLLWAGQPREVAAFLRPRIRFHNHKAAYIVRARERFFPPEGPRLRKSLEGLGDAKATRAWLVREVDGLGWKEASHFLRNIGRGDGLGILDRHILRNLRRHGVVQRMPESLTPKRYLRIEARMESFSEDVGISMAALDLLFWSRETGEIFK
jgi:N-glycosylase/DNA lyase